jgi:hypothetical protein
MIKVTASWALYWSGDLWWRATDWLGNWFEWPHRIYNRLMGWAYILQGDDPRGPWRQPDVHL